MNKNMRNGYYQHIYLEDKENRAYILYECCLLYLIDTHKTIYFIENDKKWQEKNKFILFTIYKIFSVILF